MPLTSRKMRQSATAATLVPARDKAAQRGRRSAATRNRMQRALDLLSAHGPVRVERVRSVHRFSFTVDVHGTRVAVTTIKALVAAGLVVKRRSGDGVLYEAVKE